MASYGDQLQKIYELNLSYLLLAQRLIKQDRYAACFTLGINDERIDILQDLTLPQLIHLASMDRLICQLRVDNSATLNSVTKNSRLDALQGVHTGIILSTNLLKSLEKKEGESAASGATSDTPARRDRNPHTHYACGVTERQNLRHPGHKRM